jgi:hypothetical protein
VLRFTNMCGFPVKALMTSVTRSFPASVLRFIVGRSVMRRTVIGIATIVLLGLAFTTFASARVIPPCPDGFKQEVYHDPGGENFYSCKLSLPKKDVYDSGQCLKWEGTHWNTAGVTHSCGVTYPFPIQVGDFDPEQELKQQKSWADKRQAEAAKDRAEWEAERQKEEKNLVHLHLKIVKSAWVKIGVTDANGYNHAQSRPIQRLTAISADQRVFDIICYGTSWPDAFGMSTQMDNCPVLLVGTTYLMYVEGRNMSRDVPNTNKRVDWQILEACSNPTLSECQQISTLQGR